MLFYKPFSDMEVVMGHGGQLDSFEAVFSPRGADGQPRPLWDRDTGAIDPGGGEELGEVRHPPGAGAQLEDARPRSCRQDARLHGRGHLLPRRGDAARSRDRSTKLGSDAVVELFPGKDHSTLMDRAMRTRIAREMAATLRAGKTGGVTAWTRPSSPTVCIVGVGLLGGSLALALKQRGLAGRVVGTDRLPGLLSRAVERGLLDEAEPDLARAVHAADLVVFCTPVDVIAAQVLAAAAHCRPGTLLTDVGSTKAAIVRALEGRLPPGHRLRRRPPAGGVREERPGKFARLDLFEGRLVLLTPTRARPPRPSSACGPSGWPWGRASR